MRALLFPALVIALLGSSTVVAEGPTTLGYSNNRSIEPVLVRLDDHGKITNVTPAYPLSPELTRLLNANLNEMIHTPAIGKDGKPEPTQFIINLALQSDARSAGDYDVHFVYVSATPVPLGSWYWSRDSFGRLALASQNILSNYPPSRNFNPLTGAGLFASTTSSGSGGRSSGGHSH